MRISSMLYNKIIHTLPTNYETGGILGGENGTITCAVFDILQRSDSPCCYDPDVELLNSHISNWQEMGIEFYGLFHSHLGLLDSLSDADKQYAKEILQANDDVVAQLYFPIVIPNKRIISFVVRISDGRLVVSKDRIEFCSDKCSSAVNI